MLPFDHAGSAVAVSNSATRSRRMILPVAVVGNSFRNTGPDHERQERIRRRIRIEIAPGDLLTLWRV
jgi:hypothetical protein